MEFLLAFIALILGFIIGYILSKQKSHKTIDQFKLLISENEKLLLVEKTEKEIQIKNAQNTIAYIENEKETIKALLAAEQEKSDLLGNRITKAEVEYRNVVEKLNTQKAELEEIQKKFTTEFENIANKILKQNSQEFTSTNQKNISEILNPLKEKIQLFEQKVQETHIQGVRDNTSLREEVKKLYELNSKISEEANNLTKALKGDNKKQGNWGEMVLERILERSGLIKGEEYETQFTARNDHNEILRPDVVIKLPDNKHIIIDSKVSLIAYEQYVNAEAIEDKEKFSKLHIDSLKSHVKGLSEKSYASSDAFNTPDFVLMFLPIESSFSIAIQQDIELFNFAWDKRVVIVSPSTLLATLKTVESIWKREKQTQNAIEIATEGGKLYDKFASLVDDLKRLGNQLDTVQKTYQEANKKLHTGSGNLIGRVEKLRQLGAKNTKSIAEVSLKQMELLTDDLIEE
ncbi:MAG: DNA recombination protein RmuC [Bacteroidetes bacterium]|nr:DNA recombination protein RmuC [Bacteroidota bacterium]